MSRSKLPSWVRRAVFFNVLVAVLAVVFTLTEWLWIAVALMVVGLLALADVLPAGICSVLTARRLQKATSQGWMEEVVIARQKAERLENAGMYGWIGRNR